MGNRTLKIVSTDTATICQRGQKMTGVAGNKVNIMFPDGEVITGVISGSEAQLYFTKGSSESKTLHKLLSKAGASKTNPVTLEVEVLGE